MKRSIIAGVACMLLSLCTQAQDVKTTIHKHIDTLASPSMHGRGYVFNGGDIAARYIAGRFAAFGLEKMDGSYFQRYSFPINTFPGQVDLTIQNTKLTPGKDYIVHGASGEWHKGKMKLNTIDLSNAKDSFSYYKALQKVRKGDAYYLINADTPTKYLSLGIRNFAHQLPEGLYIVPKHGKMIWTANQDVVAPTIFYVEDTVLPQKMKKVKATVDTRYVPQYVAKNVIGYVKGTEVPDSFIVFSAHFDHLGRMGKDALFAGANDNASGTSLVLYLAEYFAKHPQRYSVAFMLFSGEEAGLLGSKYYVYHPLFPLQQIRFLVNLDMTGEATDGITVVNGEAHEPEFDLMSALNAQHNYMTKVRKRERTSNSDHYFFSKEGVPAFFIYTHGTKPFYHDVLDLPEQISLENVDKFAQLLIDYTNTLTNTK